MDAKAKHDERCFNDWLRYNADHSCNNDIVIGYWQRIERALSLLASVEGSSDEVVRELQRVVLPSLRDYGQGYSAAVAERAAAHIIALRAELAFTRHEADLFKSDATTFRAELASVKAHAEAMATKHEEIRTASVREIDRMEAQLHEAVDAYRAAHPKEGT